MSSAILSPGREVELEYRANVELVQDKKSKKSFDSKLRIGYQIYKQALKKGVILRPLGDVIYFNPPLIIEKDDMVCAVNVAVESLNAILK